MHIFIAWYFPAACIEMAPLKYLLKKESILLLPDKELCSSLSHKDSKLAGIMEAEKLTQSESKWGKYNQEKGTDG